MRIVRLICLAKALTRFCLAAAFPVDEWQQEIHLVDEAKFVEPFRADHSELLVILVFPIEQFLEVQEMLENLEGMYWGTPIAKDVPQSGWALDGDLEHSS